MTEGNVQPETRTTRTRVAVGFHSFAAVLLILYALSHFGFLTLRDPSFELRSTVFPFITNWSLYFFAAIAELLTGFLCWRLRGQHSANVLILSFVSIMLFYRWAFIFTGGSECGCLGLLGILLHVNKAHEKMISNGTLVLLGLTTAPWLWRLVRGLVNRLNRTTVSVAFLCFICRMASADQTLEIHGEIDTAEHNPRTGLVYSNQQWRAFFGIVISGDEISINMTNLNNPGWWRRYIYDGTNAYSIVPFETGAMDPHGVPIGILATIEPSGLYLSPNPDDMGGSVLWLAFGLRPTLVQSNRFGVLEIPLGGSSTRHNPSDFGWKWIVQFSTNGKFVSSCSIVRETKLDLPDKRAFLRFDMDYPESLGEYNKYEDSLRAKNSIPQGFLFGKYTCLQWYTTNGLSIPLKSEMDVNLASFHTWPHFWRVSDIKVSDVRLYNASDELLPKITASMVVHDYRYKKSNQTRIFKFAQYKLTPGESWKPDNDPTLLSTANDWLKHGRKYDDFGQTSKSVLVWSVFVMLVLAPIAAILLDKRQKQKQKT